MSRESSIFNSMQMESRPSGSRMSLQEGDNDEEKLFYENNRN
jgi:hypothetical protein